MKCPNNLGTLGGNKNCSKLVILTPQTVYTDSSRFYRDDGKYDFRAFVPLIQ